MDKILQTSDKILVGDNYTGNLAVFNGKIFVYDFDKQPDPYNPLNLPQNTFRVQFKNGYTPTMGDSQTLVDSSNNIWDIHFTGNSAAGLFQEDISIDDSAHYLLNVLGANTKNVVNTASLFGYCRLLTNVELFDTSSVITMYYMFSDCSNLLSIPMLDTSNVTNMECMFYHCKLITTIPAFNTSKVTTMRMMFDYCDSLTQIPMLDTSNVTNMSSMFSYCKLLTNIPLLDTSKVTNMEYMFMYCTNITEIPMLDTHNVTNMSCTFERCDTITTIPLLDTSNVTNMSYMFGGCKNIVTIPLIDTSKVTNMHRMFINSNIKTVPNLNVASVTTMNSIFESCPELTAVPLFQNTDNLVDAGRMFLQCRKVQSGALALYQQLSTQTNPPTEHTSTFAGCGVDTETGTIEYDQIPRSWGGDLIE